VEPVNELLEFLLARVAEDKAQATRHLPDAQRHGWGSYPARFLAECEAKRRIVELHSPDPYYGGCELDGVHRPPHDGDPVDVDPYPCETLRLLALPYSNHLDYREEWKP
jgi:hypothetical protein